MKKLLFIAAIAGAALVSCTKNELAPSATEQHEITFASPVVGAQTKVTGAIGSTYNKGESFEVWAVYNTASISAWGGTPYFSDVTAVYDETANGWGLTPKYFWPANGMLSFVALSPATDKTTTFDATNGFTIDDWAQGATEANIIDLMYSDISFDNAKIEFGADGDELSGDQHSYKGVDIKFNHALSYLVFNIKTAADYSATTKFQLTNIQLTDIHTTGDFKQKATDPWTEDTSTSGTYNAYTGTLPFGEGTGVTTVTETTGKEIILLPQALTTGTQKITISYNISTDGGTTWIPQKQTADLTTTAVPKWEMGKKYTYTITIGMTEIIFDPAVSNWTNGTGGEIEL